LPAMPTAYITHADCLRHEMGAGHPENPDRLSAINEHMRQSGLLDELRCLEAPLAHADDLKRVHRAAYVDLIFENAPAEGYVQLDPDTAMNPHSLAAARRAAGAGMLAVDEVMAGRSSNAFCAVRPCGHHATPLRSMGFCIFNNIGVAAAYALEKKGLERVAIIDFDVHHGNPLAAGSGGAAAKQALETHWLPALESFKPQMIFISAGFDAHREDLLGGMALVEADYTWMTRELMDLAARHSQGRIVSMLEGGYNLSALGRSVVAHVKALSEPQEARVGAAS